MGIFKDEYGSATAFAAALIALTAVVVLTAAFMAIGNAFAAVSCKQLGEMTGRETAYRFPAGCFVKNDGQLIPADEFKARAITNERGSE